MSRPIAIVLAAVLVVLAATFAGLAALANRTPPPGDPGIQERADQAAAKLQEEREARDLAREEAKLVRMPFPEDGILDVFFAADSLGAGYYSSTRELAYRNLVIESLSQHGPTEGIVATKPADEPLFQVGNVEGVPDELDLAVIELGTNDAGRTELPVFREQYLALINDIRVASPDVPIICAGVWGSEGGERAKYDRVIREVCLESNAKYVDLTDAYMEGDTYGPEGAPSWAGPADNFHPNDKGHRMIADLLLERIKIDS